MTEYPETCSQCGAPARWTTLIDERVGIEDFLFCTNQDCLYYDRLHIEAQRHKVEDEARKLKAYRRHLEKERELAYQLTAEARRRNKQMTYTV